MKKNKTRKGQEEMVGFSVILVIVAVLILVFISFSISRNSNNNVESFEVESFLQAMMQYTTECEDGIRGNLDLEDLMSKCVDKELCDNSENSCEMLEQTIKEITSETWRYGEGRPIKGYFLNITAEGEELMSLNQGNSSNNLRSAKKLSPGRNNIEVYLEIYS